MQTYYKLEDYHWEEINNRGFNINQEVYFVDVDSYDNKIINIGKIIGHIIDIEGSIELKLEIIERYVEHIPDDVFSVEDETQREYTYIKEVFMDNCFFNKNNAIKYAKNIIKNRIKNYESKIKYEFKKLKKLR